MRQLEPVSLAPSCLLTEITGVASVLGISAGQYATISSTLGRPLPNPVTVGGPFSASGAISLVKRSTDAAIFRAHAHAQNHFGDAPARFPRQRPVASIHAAKFRTDRIKPQPQPVQPLPQNPIRRLRFGVRVRPGIHQRADRFEPGRIADRDFVDVGRRPARESRVKRTRSGPSCLSWMLVKSAMQSGVMYSRGSPISYSSCSLMEATVMRPPVPACLVITNVPSGSASTIG